MDWDFYYHPAKKRAKKNPYRTRYTTRQRTIKGYTKTIQEIKTKSSRAASASHDKNHGKAIPKEHEWGYQEEFIEDYEYEGVTCRYFRAALRHRFTSPDACMAEWMNIQQSSTQYCVNRRTKVINTTMDYNSGNGSYCQITHTLLKAFKRALQEMLGCGRWYGTMPMGCVMAWVIETTDHEEVKAPRR
jgi:hypothetical protein